jgi:hypothetical protein
MDENQLRNTGGSGDPGADPGLVPVELNLAELPWFIPAGRKVLHHEIEMGEGRKLIMSCAHGIPSSFDVDVYLVCCALAMRHGSHDKVPFSIKGILDMLGCSNYLADRVKQSFLRLYETVSIFRNSYYKDGQYVTLTRSCDFRFITGFNFYEKNASELTIWDAAQENWFTLQREVYENIVAKYFRYIDLRELRSISDGMEKRLYLLYTKHLGSQQSFSIRFATLAAKLPLIVFTKWREKKRSLEILVRLHEALQKKGIFGYSYDPREERFTVFRAGQKPSIPEPAKPGEVGQDSAPVESPEQGLVREFVQRACGGVREPFGKELAYAAQLIAEHGLERVRYLMEYALQHAPATNYRMKTFNAVSVYETEALTELARQESDRLRREEYARKQREESDRQEREQRETARLRVLLEKLRTDDPARYAVLRAEAESAVRSKYHSPELAGELGIEFEILNIIGQHKGAPDERNNP